MHAYKDIYVEVSIPNLYRHDCSYFIRSYRQQFDR